MARDMVVRYGMSDVMGPMVYGENENEVFLGRSVTQSKHISESTMEKVDAEVRRIIDEQYAIARKLIESHQEEMHKMAHALLEWETIDAEQIDDIMNGKDPRFAERTKKRLSRLKENRPLRQLRQKRRRSRLRRPSRLNLKRTLNRLKLLPRK